MRKTLLLISVSALMIVPGLAAQQKAKASDVTRGKYIVERTGLCGDCHSPMDEKGNPLPGQALKGAALGFKATVPVPDWVDVAPPIAGLPGWTEEQGVHFLMTGIAPSGKPARPPMPQYRYNREEAEAIVAYLKSLGSGR